MNFENELLPYLKSRDLGLSDAQIERAARFGVLLYEENERQNLTRIEGLQDFVDGHLVDVLELFKLPQLSGRVCDVGAGSGVPGLLAAALDSSARDWLLVESEVHKANYLAASADTLGLEHVQVFSERAEVAVKAAAPFTVIARAVGPVDRIAAWIWNCSTWNNLVLFKSRGWEEEWKRAQLTKFGKKLTVTHSHEYSIGKKYRVLVNLERT